MIFSKKLLIHSISILFLMIYDLQNIYDERDSYNFQMHYFNTFTRIHGMIFIIIYFWRARCILKYVTLFRIHQIRESFFEQVIEMSRIFRAILWNNYIQSNVQCCSVFTSYRWISSPCPFLRQLRQVIGWIKKKPWNRPIFWGYLKFVKSQFVDDGSEVKIW